MIEWVLVAVMVSADVASDLLMSRGMKQVGQAVDLNFWHLVRLPIRALHNFSFLGAVTLAAVHFAAFLVLLSFWDLSLVIPIGALVYVLGTCAARFLLGESVTLLRWTGVFLIAAGVAIASAT